MLAYVFWHWPRPDVPAAAYEAVQRRFHAALEAAPPPGFLGSRSVAIAGASWAAGGGPAYEDRHLVRQAGRHELWRALRHARPARGRGGRRALGTADDARTDAGVLPAHRSPGAAAGAAGGRGPELPSGVALTRGCRDDSRQC